MIPAKITNLNPVQVTYKRTIDVEDVTKGDEDGLPSDRWICIDKEYFFLSLNQSCFIELSGEGKCKIVKL